MNRIAFLPLSFFFIALFGSDIVRPPVDSTEFAHRVVFELEGGDANDDGCIDGRDVEAYVRQAEFAGMALHPLAADYIRVRKIWLTQWAGQMPSTVKDAVWRALCGAEYQALTGDTTFELETLALCKAIVHVWPGELTPYLVYVTNPEPMAQQLARIASVNDKAREILGPLLELLLRQIREGTHGNASKDGSPCNFGKISLCRMEILESLRIPHSRFDDYGVNKGLAWHLAHTTRGWLQWLTGSPWYQIFNEPIVEMGWDVREQMTPWQRLAFFQVYAFAFEFQIDGKTPYVGEDWDKLQLELAGGPKWSKGYVLWTGYAWRWRGADQMSTYMRWRALHELGMATYWRDLKCPPTPDWCPPRPPLQEVSNWLPYALIVRVESEGRMTERMYFYTALPSIDNSHLGIARERSEVVKR